MVEGHCEGMRVCCGLWHTLSCLWQGCLDSHHIEESVQLNLLFCKQALYPLQDGPKQVELLTYGLGGSITVLVQLLLENIACICDPICENPALRKIGPQCVLGSYD